jgi:hypothetical protein
VIRFNFKGTLQRLAQVRAFLGDINTPGGLGDATASDILAARAGGAVMLPVMTGLPLGKRCSRPAGVRLDGFRPSAFSKQTQRAPEIGRLPRSAARFRFLASQTS